jgi:hypothetical protein
MLPAQTEVATSHGAFRVDDPVAARQWPWSKLCAAKLRVCNRTMNSAGLERVNWLCRHIQEEQDQQLFDELISELSGLLDVNGSPLRESPKDRHGS